MKKSPVAKKPSLSQELRSRRIHEVEADLTDLDTRLRYSEKAREKFATVKQYEHAAEKSKEIMSLRADKRKFQAEMAQLQKQKRSKRSTMTHQQRRRHTVNKLKRINP